MGYLSLFKRHPREIGFGFIQAFFSGLGQTHFVSLYSPFFMAQFALSNSQYGSIYSLVTLLSGLVIPFLGPLIDRANARYFSLFIGLGLFLSQLLLLSAQSVILLGAALFGLRLFGQGLCSSISSITVARYFNKDRGKALALSQMGFPFYEGLITPLCAFLLGFLSLQALSLGLMASILVVFIPLTFFLTKDISSFNKADDHSSAKQENHGGEVSWSRLDVFKDKTIYFLLAQVLYPPFALTGLLFHQAALANLKGWSLSLMASGLVFFAIGRVVNTFITGPLVDKYTARKLFPYYQIPLSLGFFYLAWGDSYFVPAICFALFGLSVGSGGPIKSAIWAELYGVKHLGAIKSLFATLMVLSTAISPALFGYILDHSEHTGELLYPLLLAHLVASILSYVGLKLHRQKSVSD